jgi:Tol biopolymer transport system component
VLGGEQTRLTDSGWRPRFSPDGHRIVYQGPGTRPGGGLWLIPAGGGQARPIEIRNQVDLGGLPVWTPDGQHIMFIGFDQNRVTDWWLVSPEGGEAVPSGLAAQLRTQGLGDLSVESAPADWLGNEMLFSLVGGASANLWLAPFSTRTWKVSGPLRQLTFGSAMELSPRASAGGRVVFSGDTLLTHLWSVPLGSGEPHPLTKDTSLRPGHFRMAVRFSLSDRYLAFASPRSGNSDVWLLDLNRGAETALASTSDPEEHPLFSPDGKAVAFVVTRGGRRALHIADLDRRLSREVCGGCGEPYGWLPDSRTLLYGAPRGRVTDLGAVDVSSGTRTEWVRRDDLSVRHATVSPDASWAMLVTASLAGGEVNLLIVPLEGGTPAEQARWITVPTAEPEGPVVFSPSGDRVYYLASADGFRCIWTHPFRPATGSLGPAQPLRHFHNSHFAPWNSWLALSGGRFVLAMTESSSSLWSFTVSR